MVYITLDTCVWLELLKIDFKTKDNLFEELCFWIENKHITHIAPENIIKEWNRQKMKIQSEIITQLRKLRESDTLFFKHNTELRSTYDPHSVNDSVQKRVERVDLVLNSYSEKAAQNDAILKAAADRNLDTLAPNHRKDSFRDTVNIFTLIEHLKVKRYPKSYFSTLNYADFCIDGSDRYELHKQLTKEFSDVNLYYIYFDEKQNFGGKLFNILRKEHSLPNFQDYLKHKEKEETERLVQHAKISMDTNIENPDTDYLENVKYIDIILSKASTTSFEKEILANLIKRHDSYKQYFFKNVGNNGLV